MTTSAARRAEAAVPAEPGLLGRHRLFVGALVLGAIVRLVVFAGFQSGFVVSDAHTYLRLAGDLAPYPDRVVGYSAFLAPFVLVHVPLWYITGVQHLLGLAVAVLGYALLRRWGVGTVAATLAMVPVLFDALQLLLEHTILSDVLYELVLLGGIAALAWRREPTARTAALGGFLLALSVLVRIVGEPVLLGALVFCLAASQTWRTRIVTSLVVTAAFVVPLVAYAAWFRAELGPFALTTSSGRSLYMRTTTFVDCSKFHVPTYERRLCPAEPIGQRKDPTHYGWHNPDNTAGLRPPAGVTVDRAFRDFARRAMKAQPLDYARTVARDSWLPLDYERGDRYEYDTVWKWRFATWAQVPPLAAAGQIYAQHGGPYRTWAPLADFMVGYGHNVYLRGPLLGLLLGLSVAGLVWPRRPRSTRPLLLLTLSLGVGLTLVPVVTGEFVWRYTLPALLLVPMAAACGWARLRGPSE